MLCAKCKRKAESNLKHLGPLCSFCFCTLIEKRIRKYVRINKFFKKNDNILVVGDLCYHLVKSIIKDLPVKIIKSDKLLNSKNSKGLENSKNSQKIKKLKNYKTVIPYTLDDEANSFLGSIFSNKKIKENNHIKLLKTIKDEEAALFAKFKKLKFTPNKKNREIQEMLDKLEEKYPGTKFSLGKSCEGMKELK